MKLRFKRLLVLAALLTATPVCALAQGHIARWTEEPGELGLGYPVPMPVDTPLPFDGFRSYAGLHMRHQDLAAGTGLVHGIEIGVTRDGRTIWAYQLGDADLLTRDKLPEPAMLTNGGIHAREWQSPEVVTGIMELLAENRGDRYLYDYLLDNANIVLIPVLNIDGFLQTQRYPDQSWLRTDPRDAPDDPAPTPRDGRMRRKNMLLADELMTTRQDHLFGVDLNRNNPPFWASTPDRSSPSVTSLVYHGGAAHSEPETRALAAAALLGPESSLRMYTDVHSFSQVHFWIKTANTRLTGNTRALLKTFSDHHSAFPAGKYYQFSGQENGNPNGGIGLTSEYFAHTYQIPSWTLEIEPTNGQPFFPQWPGCGADYGGFASNCHDGFILPESEIRRVREQLAQSFATAYYRQSGPPAVTAVRFVDEATRAVVFEAEWDPADGNQRVLYTHQLQPIQLGRDYRLWIAYDKPMRWRSNGQVLPFPGLGPDSLDLELDIFVDAGRLNDQADDANWLDTPGDAPGGFFRYRDDAFSTTIVFPPDDVNSGLVDSVATATLHHSALDMTGQPVDADPASPVGWVAGGWSGYENGDADSTIRFQVTSEAQAAPFVVEPGTSAAWYDPSHRGEGFVIEILSGGRAVMYWFTFDDDGEQVWYVGVGEVVGNRLVFQELIITSGGVFGPDFRPEDVVRSVAGSAVFLFESCGTGTMVYDLEDRKGRFDLERLSRVMGANCGRFLGPPIREESVQSGSWFNSGQSGHGFTVEVLAGGGVLVYWFAYDFNGDQAWFFGTGEIEGEELVIREVFQTRGPVFGPEFDPDDLELIPWGELRFRLGCSSGSVTYDGSLAGFGSGTIELDRLSFLAGLECGD